MAIYTEDMQCTASLQQQITVTVTAVPPLHILVSVWIGVEYNYDVCRAVCSDHNELHCMILKPDKSSQ